MVLSLKSVNGSTVWEGYPHKHTVQTVSAYLKTMKKPSTKVLNFDLLVITVVKIYEVQIVCHCVKANFRAGMTATEVKHKCSNHSKALAPTNTAFNFAYFVPRSPCSFPVRSTAGDGFGLALRAICATDYYETFESISPVLSQIEFGLE